MTIDREAAAKWHEDIADELDRQAQRKEAIRSGSRALRMEANAHRVAAQDIRLLSRLLPECEPPKTIDHDFFQHPKVPFGQYGEFCGFQVRPYVSCGHGRKLHARVRECE
jgi:hypothetical protein